MSFSCDRCGECCRHLNWSALYADLDRGDGVCRYLEGDLCGIYEQRPLKCRVDEGYELFKHSMSREEYDEANRRSCEMLKRLKRG